MLTPLLYTDTMAAYTSITIIYNPNSTGPGKRLAQDLARELKRKVPGADPLVIPTEHAGHGEELAYQAALASKHPLVISASGDGGYNDVINGLMRAQAEGARPVAGLLPAGNANDHFRTLKKTDPLTAILERKERKIDLLQILSSRNGQRLVRFAHSYIGLGITPQVAAEFNRTQLNRFSEVWIAIRTLLRVRPVRLMIHGELQSFDSIVISNISKMSKYYKLSRVASPHDGKLELTTYRHQPRWKMLATIARVTFLGSREDRQVKRFVFQPVESIALQLDGEVMHIDAGAHTTVTVAAGSLRCLA